MNVLEDSRLARLRNCLNTKCDIKNQYFKDAVEVDNLQRKLASTEDAMAVLFSIIGNLFSFMAGNLKQKITEGKGLRFDDLNQIEGILKQLPGPHIIDEVVSLLDICIEEIRKRSNVDCIADLLTFEGITVENYGFYKSNSMSDIDLINTKIRALTLFEYRDAIRKEGVKFIDGKINYADYIESLNANTKKAGEVYPK